MLNPMAYISASLKVAERLGGVRDREAEEAHGNKVVVYRYL